MMLMLSFLKNKIRSEASSSETHPNLTAIRYLLFWPVCSSFILSPLKPIFHRNMSIKLSLNKGWNGFFFMDLSFENVQELHCSIAPVCLERITDRRFPGPINQMRMIDFYCQEGREMVLQYWPLRAFHYTSNACSEGGASFLHTEHSFTQCADTRDDSKMFSLKARLQSLWIVTAWRFTSIES